MGKNRSRSGNVSVHGQNSPSPSLTIPRSEHGRAYLSQASSPHSIIFPRSREPNSPSVTSTVASTISNASRRGRQARQLALRVLPPAPEFLDLPISLWSKKPTLGGSFNSETYSPQSIRPDITGAIEASVVDLVRKGPKTCPDELLEYQYGKGSQTDVTKKQSAEDLETVVPISYKNEVKNAVKEIRNNILLENMGDQLRVLRDAITHMNLKEGTGFEKNTEEHLNFDGYMDHSPHHPSNYPIAQERAKTMEKYVKQVQSFLENTDLPSDNADELSSDATKELNTFTGSLSSITKATTWEQQVFETLKPKDKKMPVTSYHQDRPLNTISMGDSTRSDEYCNNLLEEEEATESNWKELRQQLGDQFQSITFESNVWTINLPTFEKKHLSTIPLWIAKRPVLFSYVAPVFNFGFQPFDPHIEPIDPYKSLDHKQVRLIFETFPNASSAAVLYNKTLLVNYDKKFDDLTEGTSSPVTFGGLKVELVQTRLKYTGQRSRKLKKDQFHRRVNEDPNWICLHENCKSIEIDINDPPRRGQSRFGLCLKLKDQAHNKNQLFITVSTHSLQWHQRSRRYRQLNKRGKRKTTMRSVQEPEISAESIKKIKVYKHTRNENHDEKIAEVYKCYDMAMDPTAMKTRHEPLYRYDHDLTLLKILECKEDHFNIPEFVGHHGYLQVDWCDKKISELSEIERSQLVLLGETCIVDRVNLPPKEGSDFMEGKIFLVKKDYDQAIPAIITGEMYMRHKRENVISRCIIWRPGFCRADYENKREFEPGEPRYAIPSLEGRSGLPLALYDPSTDRYRVLAFQSFQRTLLKDDFDESQDPNQIYEKIVNGHSNSFYGAWEVPQDLIDNYEIINGASKMGFDKMDDDSEISGEIETNSNHIKITPALKANSKKRALETDDSEFTKQKAPRRRRVGN